jgi:acyl-coenzyme A synthetase/AMP-(fatty) acid ligase
VVSQKSPDLKIESDTYRAEPCSSWNAEDFFGKTKTMDELLDLGVSRRGASNPFLGVRGDGKVLSWTSYGDTIKRVDAIASGLLSLGCKPGDMVAFFLSNCSEWLLAEHACYRV